MDLDVLARDVGNELLIPIRHAVEDQTNLLFLPTHAETFGCQEHPKFQGMLNPGNPLAEVTSVREIS